MGGNQNAYIQVQDTTGYWRTYTITTNNDALIMSAMKQLKWQFPDQRVRAVDQKGSLLNIS
jgi:hypothetical protein